MKRNPLISDAKHPLQWFLALLLSLCALAPNACAQTQAAGRALLEPFKMWEDFQGNSLGQWASYPPVQDIGYEPSLSPTADYGAPGGRALMRVVQPNQPGPLRFGFIKCLRAVLSGDARLSFVYQLRTLGAGDHLEMGLAGQDGHRYTAQVAVKAEDNWTREEIALTDLRDESGRAAKTGLEIEAIYLIANIGNADPDQTYRFLIDNVALNAARDAQWEVKSPEAIHIEPWEALNSAVGYKPGDRITIKAHAPFRLTRAECVLKSGDEQALAAVPLYDDGTHGDEQAGDGLWSNSSLYTVAPSDSSGVWVAQLRGTTAEGHILVTSVRFIVGRAGINNHPRLFFGAGDRDGLIAKSRSPKFAALWSKLQAVARSSRETGDLANGGDIFTRLDPVHLLPSLLGYFDVLSRARVRISSNAFDAYLTDDPQSLAAAKAAMLDVARWQTWAPPWFEAHGQHTYYPAGELAFDMALAYDLLYDKLSEPERALVRRALIERAIIPTYQEYVVDNRAMANTSNWIAHTVGGALIAAAAIRGDGSASELGGRLELYLNGLLQKLESHLAAGYLRDGSYGEGISYQEFDLESLAPALTALDRVLGIDYWKHSAVLDSLFYPLYTMAKPTAASLDMGDSHPPSGRTIAPLVARSKDPLLYWYYNQFEHSSIIDFIFYDDSVAPRPPALPPSRLFQEKGNAVFRTGWGADDLVFLYRAGPTFNHNHNDQGSFLLTAFGENLISEAGWSDYYKDPYYATFFTQAVGHNTVLVDGNPESQLTADTNQFTALNTYPQITDVLTGEFYDALSSELSSVYRGKLERFTRRIVFVKPYYFVIYDDLAARNGSARFDWLLHLPDRARIKTSQGTVLYTGEKGALAVRPLAPTETELHIEDGHIPYPVFASSTPKTVPPQPAFIDLRTRAPMNAAQFLVALVPARTVGEAQALASHISYLKGDDFIGLQAGRGAERDLVMFRTGKASGKSQYKEWATDAAAWTMTLDGNRLKAFAVQTASTFRGAGGRVLLVSERPISLAVDYGADVVKVSTSASTQTKLQLFIMASPVKVLLDGRELAPTSGRFESTGEMLSITVPAGQHHVTITHPS